jgi:serine/threonine protein kinase/Tfp pilus assembly protein PilF
VSKPVKDHSVTSAATVVSSTGVTLPPSTSGGQEVFDPSQQVVLAGGIEASAYDKTLVGGAGGGALPVGLPERIGQYRINRLIGSGGMGAVYEAEQGNPRRTVALKVMRGAIASPQASRRFEYESQLLARLRHPCIAQVYEAGTHVETATGGVMPWFAMEFIPDAKTLTDYAAATNMSVESRLELFMRICDAVQHGHQRGIIHRDLKPANILIDSSGHPKIIDFGVARVNEEGHDHGEAATASTMAGQIVGTLQYMAPEQCGSDSIDIDVRADVYALGVILFELLTGTLPHALDGTSLFEAVMIIRDDPPAVPSTRRRELKGDLDTIILKALEKDRARRYASAADFAADLGRHLRCEPILARQIGVAGRLSRWVRRNRAVSTVIAASVTVLTVTSVVLVTRILQESARKEQALKQAQDNLRAAKDNFSLIKTFFGSMRPNQQRQGLVDVEQLLDNAARQVVEKPPQLLATEADFREIIAFGYQGLGRYAKAVEHQKRVIDLRTQLVAGEDAALADSLHQYAAALWWNGQYDDAAPIYERSLAIRRRLLGVEHLDVAMSLTHLGACRVKQDRVDEAMALYRQALEMRRKLLGRSHQDVAASLNNLAKAEALAGRIDEAEGHFREALAMIRSLNGDDDLTTATAKNNLALFLLDSGRTSDVLELITAALRTRQAKLSASHHFVLQSRMAAARAEFATAPDAAARAKAAAGASDALHALEKVLTVDHPDAIEASGHVGLMLAQAGDGPGGIRLLERTANALRSSHQATQRDRDESSLRLAAGRLFAARDEAAIAEFAALLAKIRPQRVSNALRVTCVGLLDVLPESSGRAGLRDAWGG